MHDIMMDFMIWRHLTRPRGPFRAQGFALTRNVARLGFLSGSKNLLQRGILYRHEKILLRQGRLQAQTQENYIYIYITFGRFLIDISGLINSFGLAAFVVQEYDVVLQLIPAGSSGTSI